MTPASGRDTGPHTDTGTERVVVFVTGHVQGVGFRWWTSAKGRELGLVGYARNLEDGRVEVLAQGPTAAVDALVTLLREQPSTARRPGRVRGCVVQFGQPVAGLTGFRGR